NILLEKFYTRLDPLMQLVANNVVEGYFMDKTYACTTTILDKVAKHNQSRHASDNGVGFVIGAP
ncbi:hypothetical protein HAX54_002604, partial [Datura stramonium]|nr:hypothetical protein [Datura stramonium]